MSLWKNVKDYETLYQVSDKGDVLSFEKSWDCCENLTAIRKEKLLKPVLSDKGKKAYKKVRLYKDKKWKTYPVHRLVAEHFIPKIDGKNFVNHKNGNKLDNHYSNLEWVTHKENVHHAWKIGLCKAHDSAPNSKKVICTKTGKVFKSILQAAKYLNMKEATLRAQLNGKNTNKTSLILQ